MELVENKLKDLVKSSKDSLYVTVLAEEQFDSLGEPYAILRHIYQQLTELMLQLDMPLLDVRVFIKPYFCYLGNSMKTHEFHMRNDQYCNSMGSNMLEYQYRLQSFPNVAIGGTFDHLHAGHKLMLSVAAMLSSESILCGITDDQMLSGKSYRERIEDWNIRAARVRQFLTEFAPPEIRINLIRITDAHGPTITEPNLQALIVSPETIPGGISSKCAS